MKNREELIKSLNLSGIGLEVGVFEGKFSHSILTNSQLHMFLIDNWLSEKMNIAMMATIVRLRSFEGRFTIIRDNSLHASALFNDHFFDFIYIDASHDYTSVKRDIEAWFPKLKLGGIIAGHDYFDRDPSFGVKSAVDEYFKNYTISVTEEPCPSWWINT